MMRGRQRRLAPVGGGRTLPVLTMFALLIVVIVGSLSYLSSHRVMKKGAEISDLHTETRMHKLKKDDPHEAMQAQAEAHAEAHANGFMEPEGSKTFYAGIALAGSVIEGTEGTRETDEQACRLRCEKYDPPDGSNGPLCTGFSFCGDTARCKGDLLNACQLKVIPDITRLDTKMSGPDVPW